MVSLISCLSSAVVDGWDSTELEDKLRVEKYNRDTEQFEFKLSPVRFRSANSMSKLSYLKIL